MDRHFSIYIVWCMLFVCLVCAKAEEPMQEDSYTISWCVDGTIARTSVISAGNALGDNFFEPDNEICDGKSFYGWTTEPNYAHESIAPQCVDATTIPIGDIIYYAVFAEKEEGKFWIKTDLEDILPDDNVIITSSVLIKDSISNYALRYNHSTSTLEVIKIDVDGEIIISSMDEKNYGWNIENGIEGFIIRKVELENEWLYCTTSGDALLIGTNTYNKFVIENDLLRHINTGKYVAINFSKNKWWANKSNTYFPGQKIVLFKNTNCYYHTFTTSCSDNNTPLPIQIVEWKKDAIIVMYNGDPNSALDVYIGQEKHLEKITLANLIKDVAIYEIPIANLYNHPTELLKIEVGAASKTFDIPIIIFSDTSIQNLESINEFTDMVILKGGECTFTNNTISALRDVSIYGGGKLVVETNGVLNVASLTMRIGSVEDNTFVSAYPQLLLQGQLGEMSNFYIDYLTTYDRYYAFSIPYAANTKDIHYPIDIYGDNVAQDNTGSFQFQYYDGAARAATGKGWKTLEEPDGGANLIPYQGYTFWGAPKKVSVNNAAKERQKFAIHRIPIHINLQETSSKTMSVKVYGDMDTPDNDRGWNFIGIPYLSEYTGLQSDLLQIGILEKEIQNGHWTGNYDYRGDVRYITKTEDGKSYISQEVSKAILSPFNTYFVQIAQDGELLFNRSSETTKYSVSQQPSKEIKIGLKLLCLDDEDRMGLLIADHFTDEYEINADLSKFEKHGLSLYSISNISHHAYMAINKNTAEKPISIGYKVLETGYYTFQIDDVLCGEDELMGLYLIDYEEGVTIDLLQSEYSFYSQAGTYNKRFALRTEFAGQNLASLLFDETTLQVSIESKMLKISNVFTDAEIMVCDIMGKIIHKGLTNQSDLLIPLPKGSYLVHVRNIRGSNVVKVFIP